MASKAKVIMNAHPDARLRVAERLASAARRAAWRDDKLKKAKHCPACASPFSKGAHRATVDHIVPLAKGGADEPANWQILCQKCNTMKGCASPAPTPNAPSPRFIAGELLPLALAWAEHFRQEHGLKRFHPIHNAILWRAIQSQKQRDSLGLVDPSPSPTPSKEAPNA